MLGTDALSWKFCGSEWVLYRQGSKAPQRFVVHDGRIPGMWRVKSRDGELSDMVNLSRAKDAAASLLMIEVNAQERRNLSQLVG